MRGFALESVRPESVGVKLHGLLSFVKAAERAGIQLHSFMLIRHGKIASELYYRPFQKNLKHNLYSCSKSIAATAVGFAVAENRIELDQPICDLLKEKLDAPAHPYISALTVEHLLKMATPFSNFIDPVTDDWTREFLNAPPDHYPGTLFGYDTSGTHALCEIVQRVTKQTLHQYLAPRLFEPIGITDIEWEMSLFGINRGGGGVRMTTRDMARFGLLYVNRGRCENRQILPEGWAQRATARHIDSSNAIGMYGGSIGYGYQFWCLPENAFACLGLGGQMIVGLPKQDCVFVTTANTMNGAGGSYQALDLFWAYICPAIHNAPISLNEQAYQDWSALEQRASVILPDGTLQSTRFKQLQGRTFYSQKAKVFNSVKLRCEDGDCVLALEGENGEDCIRFRFGEYAFSKTPLQKYICEYQFWGHYSFPGQANPRQRSRCATIGTWTDKDTLIIKTHLLDTVQSFTITAHFDERQCTVQIVPYGVFSYAIFPCAETFA